MSSVWRYDGRRVIVSGGGGGGMGAACVRELIDLGAEIHVLDVREPPVDVASYQPTDLRDPTAVASAVDRIGGGIDALFNCAGLPGGKFPDLDVMLVNFVGMATWLNWSPPERRPVVRSPASPLARAALGRRTSRNGRPSRRARASKRVRGKISTLMAVLSRGSLPDRSTWRRYWRTCSADYGLLRLAPASGDRVDAEMLWTRSTARSEHLLRGHVWQLRQALSKKELRVVGQP